MSEQQYEMGEQNAPARPAEFGGLIDAMPSIAEAVGMFADESLRERAFNLLIAALGVEGHAPTRLRMVDPVAPPTPASEKASSVTAGAREGGEEPVVTVVPPAPAGNGSRRKRTSKKWEPVRDLEFRPEGKQSFKDLVAEKDPKTIDQKNVLAVYWLEQVGEIAQIGVGQVLAAYKECDWREPADLANSLQATASREHWIDTADMKAIITTPSGRNVVKFDMPIKKSA